MERERADDTVRAQQLAAVVATLGWVPWPALGGALLVFALGWSRAAPWLGSALAAPFVLGTALAAVTSRRFRPLRAGPRARASATRILIFSAACLGCAWAAVPLALFEQLDGSGRSLVATATVAAIALAPLVGPMMPIVAALLVPISIGFTGAALRVGGIANGTLAVLVVGTGTLVLLVSRRRCAAWLDDRSLALHAAGKSELVALFSADGLTGPPGAAWLWQTDREHRLIDVSARLAAVTGRRPSQLEGKPFTRMTLGAVAAFAPSDSAQGLLGAMTGERAFDGVDVEHRADDGTSVWWRLSARPRFDAVKKFDGYRGIGWDVTDLHRAEQRIDHIAGHDPLTGLMSREAFVSRVARECLASALDGELRALLLIDLDAFGEINSNFGYHNGDKLLGGVADRLRAIVPRSAAVTRLGGDEFAVLYTPSHRNNATTLARAIISALHKPFEIGDDPVPLRVGVGVAIAPDHATEGDALFRKAGIALERSKQRRDGSAVPFLPEFEHAHLIQRAFEDDIRLGLARGEFAMHFQPLFDLGSNAIIAFEALIRWSSSTRGEVSPGDFIPAAESGGLIIAIGRFVLLESCRAAASWREPARVAVNISPKHIRSPDFMDDVGAALRLSGLAPTRLEIEITEGVFLEHAQEAVVNLHALRARGIRIALDDFGTGYSSLNYLTNFPVDKIKIDRSFIAPLLERAENRMVVETILTLARKLGLRVTAEGVETAEQALALKLRRCDDIQGYLVSKAIPAAGVDAAFTAVPAALRHRVPALFEGPLAAAMLMRAKAAA